MQKKIICLGAITIDRKFKSSQPLQLGTSNIVSSVQSFGGVAHNVAKNLAQLTEGVYLQSAVGNDVSGQQVMEYLARSNIETNYINTLEQQKTAEYNVVLNHDGEMLIALADMAIFNELSEDLLTCTVEMLTSHDILFIDTNLPIQIISSIIEYCRANHIALYVDPVSVQKSKKLPENLNGIYIIKPDRYEAEALTGVVIQNAADAIAAGIKLHQRGVEHCIISLGKEGYVIVNDHIQQLFSVPFVENIVDVSGAGDAFFAGVIYASQLGHTILEACQYGAAAAAMTLQSEETVSCNITVNNINQFKTLSESKDHAIIF